MKSAKLALWISVAINIAFILVFAEKRVASRKNSSNSGPSYFEQWNQARESVYHTLTIDSGDIVFVGNSLTEQFPVGEIFHNTRIKNRGIGGNESLQIKARIAEVAIHHPSRIFLEAGINDLLNKVPMDTLKSNFKQIIDSIRSLSPQTQIFTETILPVGKSHADLQSQIVDFNNWLRQYSQETGLTFLDLYSGFTTTGTLAPDLTWDDIHLTGKGYEIWKNQIKDLVK